MVAIVSCWSACSWWNGSTLPTPIVIQQSMSVTCVGLFSSSPLAMSYSSPNPSCIVSMSEHLSWFDEKPGLKKPVLEEDEEGVTLEAEGTARFWSRILSFSPREDVLLLLTTKLGMLGFTGMSCCLSSELTWHRWKAVTLKAYPRTSSLTRATNGFRGSNTQKE